jgi:epoxyqueuosine reductase
MSILISDVARQPTSVRPGAARVPETVEATVRAEAHEFGFDAVGFVRLGPVPERAERLKAFVAAGRHGDMDWIETTADRRADPTVLWPAARSAVMVGMSYGPEVDPMQALEKTDRGTISVYAQGKDYHEILKPKLKRLAGTLAKLTHAEVKVFVDTAPLMEKPLAALAGLGWQGKHTNLVSRAHGSWLFLGAILTAADLEPDVAEVDHCGSCRRCLDVCPTAAFPAPYQLDARRCIAYLTIEHKGQIAREFRVAMGNRVFGCDDCLAVCPWNKFALAARELRLAARAETNSPPLGDLLELEDAGFRARFAGTPVKRTGRDRFVRNVLVAAGNSKDRTLVPRVRALLDDASPLVRGMAVWALARLVNTIEFQRERDTRLGSETEDDVRSEWLMETT